MNIIHTGKLLASLREAGAYEGLSVYLLRQAIPQAEGSSLAALVRDRQAFTPGLSRTQAVQDLTAEYVDSRLFTDADAIRQLAEARPETARQILDWLRSAESPDDSLIHAEKLYSQALGVEQKAAQSVVMKEETTTSDQVVPENGSLSNIEARKWYLKQENMIPQLLDKNLSFEQQAKQAFDLRNQFRTQARELMADRNLAEILYKTEPNLTWEELIQKQIDKGFSGDEIYKSIIESSQRSRKSVNQLLGLERSE